MTPAREAEGQGKRSRPGRTGYNHPRPPMRFRPTSIPEVLIVEAEAYGDGRGFLMETYRQREFAEAGIGFTFVQDNHPHSRGGALRGLHYQVHHPQGKLIRVLAGEVFDVAVDLRRNSPTLGSWTEVCLSAQNRLQLWIPPGFAHGFYVTSQAADVVYKIAEYYGPEWERTIRWDDPDLGIRWPPRAEEPPLVSARDQARLSFAQAEKVK